MAEPGAIVNKETLVSFIINLSVFIVVWRFLSVNVFLPFSKIFERRQQMTEGELKKAEEYREKADEIEREYELIINTEKAEIKNKIERIMIEVESTQKKFIQSTREETAKRIDETRRRILESAERVREQLKGEVPFIALKMAESVIGRELEHK